MSEARAAGRGAQGRVGTVINGKWKVDARIGSGGMATVYAATHRNGHRAALKMLHGQLSRDASTKARFLREGYVANAVGHPGVVTVEDDGVAEDGAAFLVLELLEGETIESRRLARGGALPIDEVLDIADQALAALAAAHAKGIVHRDVKPDNVFLTTDGRVKLLDFGLARMKDTSAEATKTGVTIGTPEFMPPEQAMGRRDEVDARSDVWGLGATMFTAITGKYVHDANTLHEQLIASATQRARPIRSLAPHVSPAIAKVIDRSLELEMQDRWPSAGEMQAALRAARGGRTPESHVFTADSLTVPAVSSALPMSAKPISSDKTIAMTGAIDEAALASARALAGPGDEVARSQRFEDDSTVFAGPTTIPPHSPVPTTARMSGHVGAAPGAHDLPPPRPPMHTPHDLRRPPFQQTAPSPRAFPASGYPSGMMREPRQSVPPQSSFRVEQPRPPSARGSGRVFAVIVLLMVFVIGGVGAWVFFKGRIHLR